VLRLQYRAFAKRLLTAQPNLNINAYKAEQIVRMAVVTIRPWVKSFAAELVKRHKSLEAYFDHTIPDIVRAELARGKVAGTNLARPLIARLVEFIGEEKAKYGKAPPPAAEFEIYPLFEFFLTNVDSLYLVLLADRCSRMPWGMRPQASADAKMLAGCVRQYVGLSSGRDMAQPCQPFSNFAVDYLDSLNLFLITADAWLERRALASDRLGIGDILLFFLDLEPWLHAVLEDDEVQHLNPQVILQQLCWDTQKPFAPAPEGLLPRNGAYLMWGLLKVLLLIDALRGLYVQPSAKPSVRPLGEAFPPSLIEAFDRLRNWFQLNQQEPVIPLTE
jgi:hypothetical protein